MKYSRKKRGTFYLGFNSIDLLLNTADTSHCIGREDKLKVWRLSIFVGKTRSELGPTDRPTDPYLPKELDSSKKFWGSRNKKELCWNFFPSHFSAIRRRRHFPFFINLLRTSRRCLMRSGLSFRLTSQMYSPASSKSTFLILRLMPLPPEARNRRIRGSWDIFNSPALKIRVPLYHVITVSPGKMGVYDNDLILRLIARIQSACMMRKDSFYYSWPTLTKTSGAKGVISFILRVCMTLYLHTKNIM